MPTYKVDLKDFGKEIDKLAKRHVKAADRGLHAGVLRGVNILQAASPVDTGLYAASWASDKLAELLYRLYNSAPHAAIIEVGARPHTPPIGPLLDWSKRQLQDPGQPPDYSPEVWALAKSVQNKIAKYGQDPKFVLKNHLDQIAKVIVEEVRKELKHG